MTREPNDQSLVLQFDWQLTWSFIELLCRLGPQFCTFFLGLLHFGKKAASAIWGRVVEMIEWTPSVVVGSTKKVTEDLENDGDTPTRMPDTATTQTTRSQSAWG